MARRAGKKKSQTSTINLVLAAVLVALASYFIFGFFNTTPKRTVLPTAQYFLPAVIPSSSDDNPARLQIQVLQKQLKQAGDFPTMAALIEKYREVATAALIKPTFQDIEWVNALAEFGRDTSKEETRLTPILVRALLLQQMLQTEKAAESYEMVLARLEPGTADFTTYSAFAFDRLAKMHMSAGFYKNATQTLKRAIDTREDDTFVNRWYGLYIEGLIEAGEPDSAARVARACVDEFEGRDDFVPHNCLHNKALTSLWAGDVKTATETAIKNFDLLVERLWRRDADDEPCQGTHYAMTFDHFPDEKRNSSSKVTASEITVPSAHYNSDRCSSQEWPFYLKADMMGEKWHKAELKRKFDAMRCITLEEKTPTVYSIKDAVIKSSGKVISNDDACEVYTFGYPYQNTRLHPRLSGKDTYDLQKLPVHEMKEAVIFPGLTDSNYFHFLIEGISMPLLMQYSGLELPSDYKMLVVASKMTASLLSHLKLPTSFLTQYKEFANRYHVKTAHVVDWKYNQNASDKDDYHHPEEYYLPPSTVLYTTRAMLMNGELNPGLNETVARDAVVWTRRETKNDRSIGNWREVEAAMKEVCVERGVEFLVHTGGETLAEQIALFKRAVVVVGPHGAGLSNILFSEQTTAVIELASLPDKVSVYSRLASIMGHEYWQVPSCSLQHYESGTVFSRSQAQALARTVDYILADRGFRSVCGEVEKWA